MILLLLFLFLFPFIICGQKNLEKIIKFENSIFNSCKKNNEKKKIFLFGNHWKNLPDDVTQCEQNCKVVKSKEDADIILWHVHLEKEPKIIKDKQTLIAFGMEPSNYNHERFLSKNITFLSSFKLNHDIPFLYLDYHFFEKVNNLKIPTKTEFESMKDILFISSNCGVTERNEFVKKLSKFINIDSRGACQTNTKRLEGHWSAIEPHVLNKYKFYVGFDKKMETDYVSEKFQTGFLINAVPVYRGSNRAFDYAPGNNSFIYVNDFENTEELGIYLKKISENYADWVSYFQYRKQKQSKETELFYKYINYMKFSKNGRDRGNLCRYCDHTCFFKKK